MKAHIFTEGSNTTAADRDRPIKEYYQGLFGVATSLQEDLSEFSNVHLHVISEEYGIARGSDTMASVYTEDTDPIGDEQMVSQTQSEMIDAAADADVMVILLSASIFQKTVNEVWPELVSAAKSESIWCLSAARSSIDNLAFDDLEKKSCTVLTYHRVGVARLGTETRKKLLETIEQKSTQ